MVMRAIQLQRQKVKHVFLVYNHMLHQAGRQMGDEKFESCTYLSWFYRRFCHVTQESVPEHNPFSPDYEACKRKVREISPEFLSLNEKEYLIIDEGQDMPPSFYQTLIRLGYRNIFVAADQNQQIRTNENSSRQDLEVELNIDTNEVIKLNFNFRNSYEIARLAREFYTGDRATPPPELPDRKVGNHVPKLYTYECQPGIYIEIAKHIVKTFQRNSRKLLGVITPNDGIRTIYLDALKVAKNFFNENSLPIYTYDFNNKQVVQFNQGGIVVLNAQSCKGLEFDTVVLADIHKHFIHRGDQDATKKLFYVMVFESARCSVYADETGRIQLNREYIAEE